MSVTGPFAINSVAGALKAAGETVTPASAGETDRAQGNIFSNILSEVSKLNGEAAALEEAMYAGGPVELHQVIIAGEKAGVAFELLVEARNRLVEAYQEMMRMPV